MLPAPRIIAGPLSRPLPELRAKADAPTGDAAGVRADPYLGAFQAGRERRNWALAVLDAGTSPNFVSATCLAVGRGSRLSAALAARPAQWAGWMRRRTPWRKSAEDQNPGTRRSSRWYGERFERVFQAMPDQLAAQRLPEE